MVKMIQIKLLVCLGLVAFIAACSTNQSLNTENTWHAMSRTAESITGDITVSANQITFQNGTFLSIRVVDEDSENNITLYKVISTSNPKLLNGNYICGNTPVNYLSFKKVGAKSKPNLSMTVYYAESLQLPDLVSPDQTATAANICATYNYVD
jgi:hypothetical protein